MLERDKNEDKVEQYINRQSNKTGVNKMGTADGGWINDNEYTPGDQPVE